jgi:hypothetical protein
MPAQTLWETRFNNHPLWTVAQQLRDALDGIEAPADVDAGASLYRLQWLTEVLEQHRASEDVNGYSPSMLDNVQRMVEGNILPYVLQYAADPEGYSSSLQAGATAVDTALDQMGSWPPLPSKGAAIAAGQTFSFYEKSASGAIASLTKTQSELKEELEGFRKTISDEVSKLTDSREEFERTSEEAVKEHFVAVETRLQAGADESVKVINAKRKGAEETSVELEKLDHKARKIVEAVADRTVARSYRENARNKAIAGWIWDLFGLAVGGTPLVLLLIHFFKIDPTVESTTQLTLTRLGISIAAIGLAGLCFARGSSNHHEARLAKRADIRLTTVEPFIANQDPEFQAAIREGMADRIYLQGILDADDQTDDPSLLKKALERVKKRAEEKAARDAEAQP